jgi:hypothetical protein
VGSKVQCSVGGVLVMAQPLQVVVQKLLVDRYLHLRVEKPLPAKVVGKPIDRGADTMEVILKRTVVPAL